MISTTRKKFPLSRAFVRRLSRWLVGGALLTAGMGYGATVNWDADGNPSNGLGGNGIWDTVSARFDNDGLAPDVFWSNAAGDTAVFGGVAAAVTLGEPIQAGGLTFGVNGYVLSGSALTLQGAATIAVNNASDQAAFAAPLSGAAGLVKSGAGTLVLGGTDSYTGATVISGGTLMLASAGALGAIGAGNGTVVGIGAALSLTGGISVAEAVSVSGRLANFGGDNVVSTAVQVQNGATLTAAAGRLTLSATTSLEGAAVSANVTVEGAGEIVLSGAVNLGTGILTKIGPGTLTFAQTLNALPANVTFSGGALGFVGTQNLGAVTVPTGLAYKFYGDPGAGTTATVGTGSSVIAGSALDQALLSRVSPGSTGAVLLTVDTSAALNLTGQGVALGTSDSRTAKVTGALTPAAGGYRLGGGSGTIEIASALAATPVNVGGRTYLSNGANANLGATVGAGGRLVFTSDPQLGAAGGAITLMNGGVLELAQTSPLSSSIFSQFGNPTAPFATRTLVLAGTGGTVDVPALSPTGSGLAITGVNAIVGSAGMTLTKTGIGEMYLVESQNFSGDLVIAPNGGQVELRSRGMLPNVASITIGEAGALVVDYTNSLSSRQWIGLPLPATLPGAPTATRINDAAPITLNGGRLVDRIRATVSSTETLGAVTIGPGQAELRVEATATPGGLTLASLNRGNGGGVVNVTVSSGVLGSVPDVTSSPRILITSTVNGAAPNASLVGGWLTLSGTHFLGYGANGLAQAVYTDQGAGTFTPAAGNITNLTAAGTATLNPGAAAMNALRLAATGAQTLGFDSAAQVLNIVSGGVLSDNQNVARTVGAVVDAGRLTAGAATANTPQTLYLYANQNTLTINARVVDNPNDAAATVRVVKALDGTVVLAAGTNSYSGGTAIFRGTLVAAAAGALGAGSVVVQGLSSLDLRAPGAVSGSAVAGGQPVFTAQDGAEILLSGTADYSTANDRFSIGAGATVTGNANTPAQGLASLTRVSAISAGGQILLAPGAIVRGQNLLGQVELGGVGIHNLGSAADLYFSPVAASGLSDAATLTIGPGTAWKGLSSSSAGAGWNAGTLAANGDFSLQGLYRDGVAAALTLGAANSAGSYAIANRAGQSINANVSGQVILDEDSGVSLPADLTFVVGNGALLQPNWSRSFGDPTVRAGSGVARVLVQAGGTLDPGNYVPIGLAAGQGTGTLTSPAYPVPLESPLNGAVTVEAGGRLLLNDPSGLGSSSAVVVMKTNSVLELSSATALAGSDSGYVNAGRFSFDPGVIFRIAAGNINHLQQVVIDHAAQPILEITGGNFSFTNQTNPYLVASPGTPTTAPENLTLGAGVLVVNDANDRQIAEGRGKIILGTGVTLAATNQTYLLVQEGLEIQNGAVINIGTPQYVDGLPRLGGVQFVTPNGSILPTSGSFTLNMAEGTQLSFANVNVWPDSLGINLANPVTPVPAALGLQPGVGHTLLENLDNFVEVIGPLTGNGAVLSNVANGGLAVGWGATSEFIFGGGFRRTTIPTVAANGTLSNTLRDPSIEKVGTSRMTLTGVSDSAGELRIWQGEVVIAQGGTTAFGNVRLGKGGLLTLDNSAVAATGRLGSGKNLVGQGGTLRLVGNDTTAVTETIGTLTTGGNPTSGRTNIDIVTGAARTVLSATTLDRPDNTGSRQTTWVVRSPAMGNLPGTYDPVGVYTPNPTNLLTGLFNAANPNLFSNSSFGGLAITAATGTAVVPVRPDYLGAVNFSSGGAGFLTQDIVGPGLSAFRLLAPSEYSPTFFSNAATNLNVRLAGSATASGDTRFATLTMAGGSTLNIAGLGPLNNSPSHVYVQSGGIFLQAGATSTITATGNGFLQTFAALPIYLHGPGDLNLNAPFYTETNVVKSGDGTVNFGAGAARFWRGSLVVDGGLLTLGSNNGFLPNRLTTGYAGVNITLNGGTLDLGGNSQLLTILSSENPVPYGPGAGGTLTSATPAVVSVGSVGTFSGRVTGAIALDKFSGNLFTLTNLADYTGATTVRGGTLYLRDEARLPNTPRVDLSYGTLRLDNGYLASYNDRVNPAAIINSRGGVVQLDGRAGTVVSQTFATFNATEGRTDFNVNAGASGASVIAFGNFTRAADSRATVSFNQNFGFVGALGNDTTAIRYLLPMLNGSAIAPTNGMIGGWAVVNGDNFATYQPGHGIGALGNTVDGFQAYDSTDVSTATASQNVNDGSSRTIGTSSTVSSLRLAPTVAQVVTLGAGATLTIASGGFLTNSAQSITLGRDLSGAPQGFLTSGGPDLYAWVSGAGTTVLNTVITGGVNVVKTGAGILDLRGNNTYTGVTEVQSGTLTLNTAGADGITIFAVPRDLIIRAGTVTEGQANQIHNTANVLLQGGAALNLRSAAALTETLGSLTFSSDGGAGNNLPAVTRASTQITSALNLTAANAISAFNTSASSSPTVTDLVGTLNFAGPAGVPQIVDVSGNYPGAPAGTVVLGLTINATIGAVPAGVSGGGLVKTGPGMLALGGGAGSGNAATTFGGPTTRTEVFNVQQGVVRVDDPTRLGGVNAITTVQNGAAVVLATGPVAGKEVTGSLKLNAGATLGLADLAATATTGSMLGVATGTEAAQTILNVAGDSTILLADFFTRETRGLDLQVRGKLTGSGNLNLVGVTYFTGVGGGGVLTLGNPISPGNSGANDYAGVITVNTNTVLASQRQTLAGETSTTGDELGTATVVLNGGRLRLRDDFSTTNANLSNQTATYGNNVTLAADSFLDANRTVGSGTNNTILLGDLVVNAGTQALTVDSTNNYRVGFAQLTGPGSFVKAGQSILGFGAIAPAFGGNVTIAGPKGINVGVSGNLVLPNGATLANFTVDGAHTMPASTTLNVTNTLTVGANVGQVVNGFNGVTTGALTGALALGNGASLTTGILKNQGAIGAFAGPATVTASNGLRGNGLYLTSGWPLTLNGTVMDDGATPTVLRVAGNNTVSLVGAAATHLGGTEIQSGTLRVASTGPMVNPLGSSPVRTLGYPASMSTGSTGGTLQFDGPDITHTGGLANSGTVRISGGTTRITGTVTGTAVTYVPGLLEGRFVGSSADFSAGRVLNPGDFGIRLEPRMGQMNITTGDPITGWSANETWVYTGQFYDADGKFSFAENMDDAVLVVIDGVTVLANGSFNQVTSTAYSVGQSGTTANVAGANSNANGANSTPMVNFGPGDNGWHTFEVRFRNNSGTGGTTEGNGFFKNFGFGYNADGATALDGSLYTRPIADPTADPNNPADYQRALFRTAVGGKGNIVVDDAATLNLGAFAQMNQVTLSSNGGTATLKLLNAGTHDANLLALTDPVPTDGMLAAGVLDVAAGAVVTATSLKVDPGTFTKRGPGSVSIGGLGGTQTISGDVSIEEGTLTLGAMAATSSTFFGDGTVFVNGGVLNLTGSLSGGVTVNAGRFTGASQDVNTGRVGGLTSLVGGHLDPGGSAPGRLLFNQGLDLGGGEIDLTFNGPAPGTGYDQLVATGTISLSADTPLVISLGFDPRDGVDEFIFLRNDDSSSVTGGGLFTYGGVELSEGGTFTVAGTVSQRFAISYAGGDGNDIVLTAIVPEPAAGMLLLGGLACVAGRRRRHRAPTPAK